VATFSSSILDYLSNVGDLCCYAAGDLDSFLYGFLDVEPAFPPSWSWLCWAIMGWFLCKHRRDLFPPWFLLKISACGGVPVSATGSAANFPSAFLIDGCLRGFYHNPLDPPLVFPPLFPAPVEVTSLGCGFPRISSFLLERSVCLNFNN